MTLTLDEFKSLLKADAAKAGEALLLWEKELRVPVTDSHDHQAAHDAWQVLFACDRLLQEQSAGEPEAELILADPFKAPPLDLKAASKKKTS